jgi:hypothetical protein
MQFEGVVIAIVSTTITVVVATSIVAVVIAIVAAAVGAFGSPLLGLLISDVNIIISSGGRPRARAAIVKVVATPVVLRLGRRLLAVFPLNATDVCRPSNGRRDVLLLDRFARCDSFGRDTPSATDAGGPLDLGG